MRTIEARAKRMCQRFGHHLTPTMRMIESLTVDWKDAHMVEFSPRARILGVTYAPARICNRCHRTFPVGQGPA